MASIKQLVTLTAAGLALASSAQAQTSVTVAVGRLTIITNNAEQKFKAEVDGGVVRLFGLAGIADGAAYTGITALDLTTGTGRDTIEYDIKSGGENLAIRSNTGSGDAETKVQWMILPGPASANPSLALFSGTGSTKTEVGFQSESNNTNFGFTMNGGAGRKEVKTSVLFKANPGGDTGVANIALNLGSGAHVTLFEIESEVPYGTVNLDTGNSPEVAATVRNNNQSFQFDVNLNIDAPKTSVEVVSSAGETNVNVLGDHASAASEVKYGITQTWPGNLVTNWDVSLSNGPDTFEAKTSALFGTATQIGTVNARGGNDHVRFLTDPRGCISGLTLNGAAGNDFLDISLGGNFQLSPDLGVVMNGGPGDDTLVLFTDSAIRGSGLPNDIIPVINGGAGFDRFKAFGRIISCEAPF